MTLVRRLGPFRLGNAGLFGSGGFGIMSWYVGSKQLSASATATPRYLHEVDLSAAAGSVTITLPASGTDPLYVGVVNASTVANGAKVILVQTAAAVEIVRLSAAGECVWLGRNPATGAWETVAHSLRAVYQWTWANATERLATLAGSLQVGAIGYQTDMGREYELIATTGGYSNGARWVPVPDKTLGALHVVSARPGSGSPSFVGTTDSILAGTLATRTLAITNRVTNLLRVALNTSAVASSAACYAYGGVNIFFATTGYRYVQRCVLGAVSTNWRWFQGVTASLPATDLNPNTFLSALGIGRGNGEANVQLFHNDAAGVAVQVDLGSDFPAQPANNGYELELYTVNGSSWSWQVRNLLSFAEISGVLTSEVPANNVAIGYRWYSSNGGDASAVSLDIVDVTWLQNLY